MIQKITFLHEEANKILTNNYSSKVSAIVAIVLISLILISLISLWVWFKIKNTKTKTKGFKFEHKVSELIEDYAKSTSFTYVHGGIYSYDSKMYEIDGLLVSDSLIVVLEYKAFSGYMSGDGASEYIFLSSKKGKKVRFKNPILQNEKHIKHLWNTIGKKVPIASFIIFPDDLKFNISNLDSHVLLSNLNDIKTNLSTLETSAKSLVPQINKQDFLTTLKAMKIRSKKEQQKFNQIIQKDKHE